MDQVLRQVSLPAVSAFSFDDPDTGDPPLDLGGTWEGRGVFSVDVGTPTAVVDLWNSDRKVKMVLINSEEWCLAAVNRTAEGKGNQGVFQACSLGKSGARMCTKGTHDDTPGNTRVRLRVEDPIGVYAIECPVSSASVIQTSIFSSPLFKIDGFPEPLRRLQRHELLLTLRERPALFKLILEAYPGPVVLLQWFTGEDSLSAEESKQGSEEGGSKPQPPPQLEEVAQPDGLASVLEDFASAQRPGGGGALSSPRAVRGGPPSDRTPAPRREPSTRTGPPQSAPSPNPPAPRDLFSLLGRADSSGDDDSRSRGDSIRSHDSVGTPSTSSLAISILQLDVRALEKENETLKNRLADLELRNEERDRETAEADRVLASTLREMRQKMKDLRRSRPMSGGGGGGPPSPQLLAGVIRGIGLDDYVTHPELAAFDYLPRPDLAALNYVTAAELSRATRASTSVPPRLGERLLDLESEILHPTGTLRVLGDRVQALEDKRIGTAISIQGYVFRDAPSVKAWSALSADPEKFRYMRDAWVQLTMAVADSSSMAEVLANKAAARKAGYTNYSAAQVAATFEVMFPESIIRRSHTKADAAQGGWVWTAPFGSFAVFKGNVEQSTLSQYKSNLAANAKQHQVTIDLEFPPSQTAHTKNNAIYSDVLRRGCRQATELLDCLAPFVDVLTAASVSKSAAWGKALTLIKTVFTRVHRVRSVTSEPAGYAMEWGMMKATELLDEFSKLEIVRHPDVSYAMALSALQKGGADDDG